MPPDRKENGSRVAEPGSRTRTDSTPATVDAAAEASPVPIIGGDGCLRRYPGAAVSDLLAAMPDPAAVTEHWRRICTEMTEQAARAAYERGRQDGAVEAIRAYKAAQHGVYRDALTERARWHVCCRRCRLHDHRDGCADCEDRDRETFGAPHPDDYQGRAAA